MHLFGRHWTIPQIATLSLCIIAAGIAPSLAYGSYVTRDYNRPGVTILGAGDDLSVLVTDGPARLLIANGDNPSQFGNALAAAQPFAHSRIDMLLLIGLTKDVTFLTRARNAANARHIDVIGPPSLTGSLGLPAEGLITSPRRYQLSPETTIIVEVEASTNDDSGGMPSWRISIKHRQTQLIVLSDGEVASDFPESGVATVLIVGGKDPISALDKIQPLVVIRSGSVSAEKLRENVGSNPGESIWTYRVFAGEAKSFVFTDRGLALPSGGIKVEPAKT